MRTLIGLALLLAGCTAQPRPSDDDDDTPPGDDDDGSSGQPDAGGDPSACGVVPAQLGATVLNLAAERRNQPGSMGAAQYYSLVGDFDRGAKPDKLLLQLWDQSGAFTGDVVPGTYQIAGPELSLDTCGVCAIVLGNFTPPPEQFFAARSGTVSITSVEPTLAGSLSNLQLAEFDGETGALIDGGCTTAIADLDFSAPVTIVDSDGGGGGGSQ